MKQFEKSKLYKKHIEIINSFRDICITESSFTMLRYKIEEFINELKTLNLYRYIQPKAYFNDLDWLIHDNIIQIHKEYSKMYIRCIEILFPESLNFHLNRSEMNLNRLLEGVE